MTVRDWAHFLLFRQERQMEVDNGPERVHPAETEEGAWGASPWCSRPQKIPFDAPYLWRASFLFWPAGPFVAAFPGSSQSKQPNILTALFLKLHFAVSAPPSWETGRQVNPQRSTPLIRRLTIRAHITMLWHQAWETTMRATQCLTTLIIIVLSCTTRSFLSAV